MSDEHEHVLIHGRMVQILADLEAIPKGQSAPGLRFKYRGIDDVLEALNPLLEKHNVYIRPEVLAHERTTYETSSGTVMQLVTVEVAYHFTAADGSSVRVIGLGEGADVADKAIGKALSTAFKAVCFQTFCIPTTEGGDDVEKHQHPPQRSASRMPANPTPGKAPAAPTPPVPRGEEPRGLDDTIRFGMFKEDGITWRECMTLARNNPDGRHYKWLQNVSEFPPKEGQWAQKDAEQKVMVRWGLAKIDGSEERPGGHVGDPPPPVDGPEPPF